MKPKRTSAADAPVIRVAIITLDSHLAGVVERAASRLAGDVPGLSLTLHAASTWHSEPQTLEACRAAIASADIVVATMLFMDEHIGAVLPDLTARRDDCDAMVCLMSAGEVMRLTRMGRFEMGAKDAGITRLLKRLRGAGKGNAAKSSGASQMKMLRRLPKILRFIPGTAQDVRAYFIAMQYWLASSDENVAEMVRFLVARYAAPERRAGQLTASPPAEYPEVGLYHPRLRSRMSERRADLPAGGSAGTVGLLIMRAYVLAGDTAHYDGVIAAFEARGFAVVPAFASGLDSRPAVERYFTGPDGRAAVDAIVSLTGFSLVGGPAYNNAAAAGELLARLDVPYTVAQPLEFQTVSEWEASGAGLLPVEATMMVAIPELDGAVAPTPFGGRSGRVADKRAMQPIAERCERLAERIAAMVALRRASRAERRVAVVLFNFPPNAGASGTAAFLAVWQSLFNTLTRLAAEGYTVDVPESPEALRETVLRGNAARHGTDGNVCHLIPADEHVRREPHLAEIEAQWGPAPGRALTDGRSIFVLGARLGNVLVALQPGFGYEGDPMRLLFEKGFAPTHAFSAFYRYLREDFAAHAVLHFGTHGALEFMPGKQVGLSADCWPDRLVGALPNLYLYAANNPSEGLIAKRRSAATLVSYLTPALTQAGLYRGLLDLKASIDRWRAREDGAEEADMAALIQAQASELDLAAAEPAWTDAETAIAALHRAVHELETTLMPDGLHVVGAAMEPAARADLLAAMAEARTGTRPSDETIAALVAGGDAGLAPEIAADLRRAAAHLGKDAELPALVHALDGGFVPPVVGGDLIRSPDILPTGRNLTGFDPFRIPSAFALADGAAQAARVLARHTAAGAPLPETVALVLWGTDNLKSEGGSIAQALALMGATPRFDSYGRLAGATLVPLDVLGRPRIDVMMTLSGIFRDLLPLQTRLLAEASWLAATADEPDEMNFVRKHALAEQAASGLDMETAALRVFSNAGGAYGSNVNHLIDSGAWSDEDELADTYARRKSFAYGRDGNACQQTEHLGHLLAHVDLAYQNLESVELGVTTVDHYFDTLGGISRAVARRKGAGVPVYIGDQTRGDGKVRTLAEQVALETRTRMLNPKWTEGMLKHGYEGVRQIEAHVTNVVGWSATTGEVQPWVYRRLSETYVLDRAMRERMARLNPAASARVANRLLEAQERNYWQPDEATLEALREAGDELEDILEGIAPAPGPGAPTRTAQEAA